MKSGEEVTLPLEADCHDFKDQLKCLHHQANPEDCPLEKKRLLRKAQKENPTAYSTVVTLTDSDEEIEIIVPRKPESVESPGPSSSDASARTSPEAPKAPAVLRDSEIQGTSNRENENRRENEENIPVTPQVPTTTPNPVAQDVIFIEDPLHRDTSTSGDAPAVNDPREPRSLRAVSPPNDAASSSSISSNNADPEPAPETAPEPMDVPEPMNAPEAKAHEPEEAAAPVDVSDIPAIPIDPPTIRRIRSAGIEREALDLTEAAEDAADRLNAVPASPTRMRHRARLQNTDPATAPELMDAPEAAAYEPEEALAPVDVATPAPPTRRRLRSAGNGRAALDLTEPEQVAVPVIVAGPSTRTHHRASKKSAGAPSRRARVQNARSGNSITSPITDRHTCHTRPTARSAPAPPTIRNAPVAPPAGRRNRKAQRQEQAAYARSCKRENNEALAATNVDSAPAPPGAPTASVVVNLPTTRRRRASQACSLVATVSTRRPAPSSFPAPPPTSRPAAPRRSAPGPSVPPAACAPPRARQISMGDQDAIALIGQSMHPTRAAVKQLKDKTTNGVSGAPAVKKPRKTARLQQVKRGRGGKK
ncbi:hypothetical protein GCK72_012423 [Caenorhabditis remanei]|uniref:Uncharacterized protein n=1 Tax=Caenorhabditis remanei TaxID=31234 RepID=A0A6A5GKZ8_CAERE|nr:hypothetical protein GCK72_012423 [Caenorhabditis remanei]KAF1755970.1 hypothetical protein GCK72_012423 [Caenorhabditis remanei]